MSHETGNAIREALDEAQGHLQTLENATRQIIWTLASARAVHAALAKQATGAALVGEQATIATYTAAITYMLERLPAYLQREIRLRLPAPWHPADCPHVHCQIPF